MKKIGKTIVCSIIGLCFGALIGVVISAICHIMASFVVLDFSISDFQLTLYRLIIAVCSVAVMLLGIGVGLELNKKKEWYEN